MSNCEEIVTHPKRTLREKGNRKAALEVTQKRDSSYKLIKFDGCVLRNGLACDYVIETESMAHYVELKGSDLCHAAHQLASTYAYYKKEHQKIKRNAIVVFSGSKDSSDIDYLKTTVRNKCKKTTVIVKRSRHTLSL